MINLCMCAGYLPGPYLTEDLLAPRTDPLSSRPTGDHQGAGGGPALRHRGADPRHVSTLHLQPQLHHPGSDGRQHRHRCLRGPLYHY